MNREAEHTELHIIYVNLDAEHIELHITCMEMQNTQN